MRNKLSAILSLCALYSFTSCDKHDHGPAGHTHDEKSGSDSTKKPHAQGEGEEPHSHDTIAIGPNGGRVLHGTEPHIEFLITDDRKVKIAILDDDLKAIPATDEQVSVIAGDRAAPTQLAFAKSGTILISDKALPAGDDFPVVVQLLTPTATTQTDKFQCDLSDCPTCDSLEYVCTCEH